MKPHKHAEVIKAWADGAQLQLKCSNGVWEDTNGPNWIAGFEFRIKPAEKVVRWLWVFKHSNEWYTHNRYLTDAEALEWVENHEATSSKKLDYTRQEFDE